MHAGGKRAVWLVAALAAVLLCAASGHHVFCRTLLCLYLTDTHLCLLKIIPQQSSKPSKANSDLAWIVQSSFCGVESGDFREWKEVQDFLRNAPQEQYRRQTVPTLDLWVCGLARGDTKGAVCWNPSTSISSVYNLPGPGSVGESPTGFADPFLTVSDPFPSSQQISGNPLSHAAFS